MKTRTPSSVSCRPTFVTRQYAGSGDIEMWTAAGFTGDPWPSPPQRGARSLPGALGRLKPGITLEQAQQRLDALTTSLQQTYPNEYPKQLGWSLRLERAQTSLTGNVRPTLVILLAAVSFVLLIVCVNVASLLIARASARMREFAIRQALGASRGQLVRQVLTESVLISLAGGAAALAVLLVAQRSLLALMPADVPRLAEVHADWRMVAFALVLSLATGVLVGLMPALHASAIDPNRDLRDGGRTGGGQSLRQNRSRADAGRAGGRPIGGVADRRRVARPQLLGRAESESWSRCGEACRGSDLGARSEQSQGESIPDAGATRRACQGTACAARAAPRHGANGDRHVERRSRSWAL